MDPAETFELCLPTCPGGHSSDCRDGYTCVGYPSVSNFCFPDCVENAECPDTGTCNISSGYCEGPKGLVADGGPCIFNSQCESNFCFDEASSGAPSGYCTAVCRMSEPVCAGDGVCIDLGGTTADVGFCFDGCGSAVDCRSGYNCVSNPYNPPPTDSICNWL